MTTAAHEHEEQIHHLSHLALQTITHSKTPDEPHTRGMRCGIFSAIAIASDTERHGQGRTVGELISFGADIAKTLLEVLFPHAAALRLSDAS